MKRTKSAIYLHFIWTTYCRYPLVVPEIESDVYACILAEAKKCGAEVLALGGMPDHIHLVVRKPPTISEPQLMQRIKGVSSTLIRQRVLGAGELFRWQENYGVFSFHVAQASRVIDYVQNQKQHHSDGLLRTDWEEAEEEKPE